MLCVYQKENRTFHLDGFCVEIKKSAIILFVVAIAVNIAFINNGATAAELIVHNGESIQKAVDASVPGDIITVEPGVYKEKISTYTSDLTIKALSDDPEDTIIEGPGFIIWASNVSIRGFAIKGTDDYSGIAVLNKTGKCRLENNEISDYVSGIEIPIGSESNVADNNKISNCQNGIIVFEGIENTVKNNKVSDCENGISFREGTGNFLNSNIISRCQSGIIYMEGFENLISDNRISNCKYAINVGNGDASPLENRSRVENNTVTKNEVGISVNGAGGGGYTFVSNNISFNKKLGYEDYSTGINQIYNNYFNNTENAKIGAYSRPEPTCIWNTTRTEGHNIIGGPSIGGNYWATPSGDGFSQTHCDFNGDGTSEAYYSLNGIDIDYLPLALHSENPEPVLPVANFNANITQGYAPLSVQFTDLSRYTTSLSWDFNNDKIPDSSEQSPVYVYSAPGNYTASLTAINENGTDLKQIPISVTEKVSIPLESSEKNSEETSGNLHTNETEEKSHNKNSKGSYTRLNKPEKDPEIREFSKAPVRNGKLVQFNFTENKTCILYLRFESKKIPEKTVAIVEMLKGKSILSSESPEPPTYKFFNIWIGEEKKVEKEIALQNIENAEVCFKVEKDWLNGKGIERDSIKLNIYQNGKWHQLPTHFITEDGNDLYFTSKTPEFTSFAVTGIEKSIQSESNATKTTINLEPENKTPNNHNMQNNENKTEQEKTPDTPAFNIIYSIICLFSILIYEKNIRRK